MKAKLSICLWAIFAGPFPLPGQEAATLASEDQVFLNIDFSVFPLESADWNGLLFAPSGDPTRGVEELRFNPHERTLGYSYRGPAPFRVFRSVVNAEGKEDFRAVGEAALQPTREHLILFFSLTEGAERSGPYRIQSMVDSNYTFPKDSVVFFNSTSATFYGILGEERIVLEPGASKPTDVSDYFDSPAPIALVIRNDDEVHKVLVNKIRFSADRRTLMIIRPPASPTSLRVRTQRLTEYMGGQAEANDPGA